MAIVTSHQHILNVCHSDLSKLLISIGFVSIEICAYILIIRLFPVLPVLKEKHHEDSEQIIAEKAQFSKKMSGAE